MQMQSVFVAVICQVILLVTTRQRWHAVNVAMSVPHHHDLEGCCLIALHELSWPYGEVAVRLEWW